MVPDLWKNTKLIPSLGFVSLHHMCHHINMPCVVKLKINNNNKKLNLKKLLTDYRPTSDNR